MITYMAGYMWTEIMTNSPELRGSWSLSDKALEILRWIDVIDATPQVLS